MQTKIHSIYPIPTIDEVVLSLEEKYELNQEIEEPAEFTEIDTSFIELEEKELENLLENEPMEKMKIK